LLRGVLPFVEGFRRSLRNECQELFLDEIDMSTCAKNCPV
jgi:hypothetical protein